MAQIFFQETRGVFSENVFCRHTTRPWGRRGGPVRNEVLAEKNGGYTRSLSKRIHARVKQTVRLKLPHIWCFTRTCYWHAKLSHFNVDRSIHALMPVVKTKHNFPMYETLSIPVDFFCQYR